MIIRDIFSTGDDVPVNKQKPRGYTSNIQQPQPAVAVDFPGELSQFVIRHDDHVALSDIRILTTLHEILYSQRPDFLSTRDTLHSPDRHHEKGIRRLLDIHLAYCGTLSVLSLITGRQLLMD